MRYRVALMALVLSASAGAADEPYLLKPGESPRQGYSVLVFQTDSVFYGGRIKVGASETCGNVDSRPCHFAAPDGSWPLLLDQALEYGDTTATVTVSGQRVYVYKTGQNTGRAAARAFGGLLGAVLTQPDEARADEKAPSDKGAAAAPLANVRKGSRFDVEFVSQSEPGKAREFVAPKEE